jgi:hypothetical protein
VPDAIDFKLTAQLLEGAITPSSKWLFLTMPGNPSGAVYSEAELKALGAVPGQEQSRPRPLRRDLRAHHFRRSWLRLPGQGLP